MNSELAEHRDAAVRELARRLRPWATSMADPDAFAAAFIDAMIARDWRPIPRPPGIPEPGRRDPEAAHRGAEAARAALAEARKTAS